MTLPLRNELGATIGVLVALNLVLVFGAVGLFVRMSPAIDRILEDNVPSIVAAEDVLEVLAAQPPGPIPAAARQRIEAAVERARSDVSEPSEPPVLDALTAALEPAFGGSAAARAELVLAVHRLIEINREAMHDVGGDAQELGRTGAWAAVFVGIVSIGLSLVMILRLRQRVIRPLADLQAVLVAARDGDRYRRCGRRPMPLEIRQVSAAVDRLLDERSELIARGEAHSPE